MTRAPGCSRHLMSGGNDVWIADSDALFSLRRWQSAIVAIDASALT